MVRGPGGGGGGRVGVRLGLMKTISLSTMFVLSTRGNNRQRNARGVLVAV